VDLLHYLGMSCVGEGVETLEQRDLLSIAGCDLYQGFLFAKPMPAADAGRMLLTGRPWAQQLRASRV
jgi:EAL domain-containing protein (putative c-di-GMP-specific phosphodiesterase class I)